MHPDFPVSRDFHRRRLVAIWCAHAGSMPRYPANSRVMSSRYVNFDESTKDHSISQFHVSQLQLMW